MTPGRTLVAGIGNIFFGDDGFGVEVARRLAHRPLGDGVRVVDFGIRGYDLAYALLEGYERVILIDAICRGGTPGTLYVFDPDLPASDDNGPTLEGHSLLPNTVLALVKSMGGRLGTVRVVGCEPASVPSADADVQVGLSTPVSAAIPEAVALVEQLLDTPHA